MYGEGLTRIMAVLEPPQVSAIAEDDLVESLLLLHDLHPLDVDARIQRALDRIRPYLGSHAGGVEYLGVDEEGVAQLRLQGSCDGCASSTLTVQTAIEGAIQDAAPELTGIEVAGVSAPAAPLLQVGMGPPPGWARAGPDGRGRVDHAARARPPTPARGRRRGGHGGARVFGARHALRLPGRVRGLRVDARGRRAGRRPS